MRSIFRSACPIVFIAAVLTAVFAQRAFRQYPSVEYGEAIPLPSDWSQPAEWTFARLMFPPGPLDGYRGRFDGRGRKDFRSGPRTIPVPTARLLMRCGA